MKKILILLGLAMVLFAAFFPLLGLAEATAPETPAAFDWAQMATIPGAILATLFIVQSLKFPIDRVFGKYPTRPIVFVIGFLVLLAGKSMMGELQTFPDYVLVAINSLSVGVGAMGLYEISLAKLNK